MNYNKLPQSQNRWKIISIVLFCILIVIGIIYMKQSSGEQRQLTAPGSADSSQRPTPSLLHNCPTLFWAKTSAILTKQAMTTAMPQAVTTVQPIPNELLTMTLTPSHRLTKSSNTSKAIAKAMPKATTMVDKVSSSIYKITVVILDKKREARNIIVMCFAFLF